MPLGWLGPPSGGRPWVGLDVELGEQQRYLPELELQLRVPRLLPSALAQQSYRLLLPAERVRRQRLLLLELVHQLQD